MANESAQGLDQLDTPESEYGMLLFIVEQALAKLCTVTLVKVVAVYNAGGVTPVGSVDVTPLVNQMTGDGRPVAHGIIYGIPYFRLQGADDAIILDPKVGDIGMCAFASRDISSVKVAKAAANPGSKRKFDFSDGLYFGGMLNGVPTQYIRFYSGGIEMVSPTKITLTAPEVDINASTTFKVTSPASTMSGTLAVTGDATANGKSVSTHTHTSSTVGTPTSTPN